MELGYIILADNPPEWSDSELSSELIDLLRIDAQTGMLPFWSAAVYRAVDMDRWYLLANEERRPATNIGSNRVETYNTKLGVPLPYRGALQLYELYTDDTSERGSVHGEQVVFERTVAKMRKRGKHTPISIDRAYNYWMRMRDQLHGVDDAKAEQLLGPMPRRHIVDGWPVGMKGRILNASRQSQLQVR